MKRNKSLNLFSVRLAILLLCGNFIFSQTYDILGDINSDGNVDVLDIVFLVSIILESSPEPPTNYEIWSSDMNNDGSLDVLDIVSLVAAILGGDPCPENYYACPNNESGCCVNPTLPGFHNLTDLPLINGHGSSNCWDCHTSGYGGLNSACANCHIWDYLDTQDPVHVTQVYLQSDCQYCHVDLDWTTVNFDHDDSNLPCHICHLSDLQLANTVVTGHGLLSNNCSSCHGTETWQGLNFDHATTGFILEGQHEPVQCQTCHVDNFLGFQPDCSNCHQDQYDQTSEPDHSLQTYEAEDCDICHNAFGWTPSIYLHMLPEQGPCATCHAADYSIANNIIPEHEFFPDNCTTCHISMAWDQVIFDHDTIFPLEGIHEETDCLGCHELGFEGTPSLCNGCHLDNWQATTLPDHELQVFAAEDCEMCHNAFGWTPSIFEHGLPQQAACNVCHTADFDLAGTTIEGHSGFDTDCTVCHESAAWSQVIFDHSQTNFQLVDSHDGPLCADCHADGYLNTPLNCEGCHLDNWLATTEPNHELQVFAAEDCEMCHNAVGWTPAIFEHGLPQQAACNVCHTADFDLAGTTIEGHSGFDTDCAVCHESAAWNQVIFDHSQTNFPLTDSHDGPLCAECHADGYLNTPLNCDGCHLDNWQATTLPDHELQVFAAEDCEMCHNAFGWTPSIFEHGLPQQAACNVCHTADFDLAGTTIEGHSGFDTDCAVCHESAAWNQVIFDHSQTNFPLTDSHDGPLCAECHADGYLNTPLNCDGCHYADWQAAADPDHELQVFAAEDCEMCHNAVGWTPAIFEHGLPQQAACNVCHTADFDLAGTTIEGHSGFDTDCAVCHESAAWNQVIFDHSQTNFQLVDSHDGPLCADCHADGYLNTPLNCEGCHLDNWLATTEPNHELQVFAAEDCEMCHNAVGWTPAIFEHGLPQQAACNVCHTADFDLAGTTIEGHSGFDTDCTICHESAAWNQVIFDHSQTNFQLVDSHDGPLCADCHADGYLNTPLNCDGCHLDNWQATTQPNHELQVFAAEDCEMCHNAVGWTPAIFEHGLPQQAACNVCHTADFELAGTTIEGHSGFDTDCTVCHESAAWNQVIFDHSQTNFQLVDSHDGPLCADCHADGYLNTPLNCEGCHLDNWQATTQPNHELQVFAAEDCEMCHNAVGWTPAIFEHGLPQQAACNVCHTADFDLAGTTIEGHSGFDTDCAICHESAAWNQVIFDHSQTNFPLTDSHDGPLCAECHADGYVNTPVNCQYCHDDDYAGTTNPVHISQIWLLSDCATCHNAVDWVPSIYQHLPVPTSCNICHLADLSTFNSEVPSHSTLPNDCLSCHTTDLWNDIIFNHNLTGYSLDGGHENVACLECHQDQFANTPTECSACHSTEGVGDPLPDIDHNTAPKLGAQMDNCQNCHTGMLNWTTINFGNNRHDGSQFQIYFDIYSGEHQGEWDNSCTDNCHVFGTFDDFSCYETCHESDHSQAQMLNKHCEDEGCASCSGSNGYWNVNVQYQNGSWTVPGTFVQCYTCHPDGDKDGPCGDD